MKLRVRSRRIFRQVAIVCDVEPLPLWHELLRGRRIARLESRLAHRNQSAVT